MTGYCTGFQSQRAGSCLCHGVPWNPRGVLLIILVFLSTPPGFASQAPGLAPVKSPTRVFPDSVVGGNIGPDGHADSPVSLRLWPTTTGQCSLRVIFTWPLVGTSASVGLGFPGYGVKRGTTNGEMVKGPYRAWSGARLPQECWILLRWAPLGMVWRPVWNSSLWISSFVYWKGMVKYHPITTCLRHLNITFIAKRES